MTLKWRPAEPSNIPDAEARHLYHRDIHDELVPHAPPKKTSESAHIAANGQKFAKTLLTEIKASMASRVLMVRRGLQTVRRPSKQALRTSRVLPEELPALFNVRLAHIKPL
ncbi:hypothetical protein Hypma_002704 [Hypsizygus marmoreus]|uniref:Uncharacterized protein n=1 Tax=Hypsizygus marmoreus TaxID=39966 RepID=A0A369J562_HYPMA|nr:hypothetical protein Hypma_002704 [Hypsizygus marmoreus]